MPKPCECATAGSISSARLKKLEYQPSEAERAAGLAKLREIGALIGSVTFPVK
jgi:hypothetical protein